MIGAPPAPLRFEVGPGQIATGPPESRGLHRDTVRLMVAHDDGIVHSRFDSIAAFLTPGDLLVVNSSPTMPAALRGAMRGETVGIHLSTLQDDGTWIVEVRQGGNDGPILGALPNEVIRLLPGGSVRLIESADGGRGGGTRLWRAAIDVEGGMRRFLARHGRPIRYKYVEREWPLFMYQTVFADGRSWPGSAEMPSAGRPFSDRLVARLQRQGVNLASVRLDTGVSSQESGELPYPERFAVSRTTARIVNRTRSAGGRVVAVGTTVTRALESAADRSGMIEGAAGWTDLVLGPERPTRVVDGLITGFHPPDASHLDLLRAVAGSDVVAAAYEEAVEHGYLWHEFGDSCLLLGDMRSAGFSVAA